MIGHLSDEGKARIFGDSLYVQGIENQIEAEKDGSWVVWIHAEEELERAKGLLADFQKNPADPKFKNSGEAEEMRKQKDKEQARYEKRMKDGQQLFRQRTYYGVGPVTVVLMCISVVVFLISKFGNDIRPELPLFITESIVPGAYGFHGLIDLGNRLMNLRELLPEIFHGQAWRLFTPMFIHMNFLHIFFNMLWLWDLGGMIEARQSSWFLAIMVLILAVISNLAQFLFNGPFFGGMSGVVYGLFGYIWIRAKFDPWCGLFLHPTTVAMMIIWFFVCLIGIMGPVANTCHAAGLLTGMAWGYLASLRRRS
jgi:GlpG protein